MTRPSFISYFFNDPSQDFGLATALFFIIVWQNLGKLEKWIAILAIISTLGDAVAAYVGFCFHETNYRVYNIAVFIETLIVMYIYYQVIQSELWKRIVQICSYVFIVIYLINYSMIQGWKDFNSYTIISVMAIIPVFAYIHLRQEIEQTSSSPFLNYFFWFSIANLVHYAASIPVEAMFNWYVTINRDVAYEIYDTVNTTIYCSWFIILIIGYLWTHKQRKLVSS